MADLLFHAVGDVAVQRPNPESMFSHLGDVLRSSAFTFGQLETPVSTRGSPAPHPTLAVRSSPAGLAACRAAGFNVMSFAGNHCMDFGAEAFFDTSAHASAMGIELCGVGANLAAAREPALLTRDGVTMAFLAYSSILPAGYWAESTRPGCAPMRAHTHYEQTELDQPGTPPLIRTFAHSGDLAALCEDVESARKRADIVALSMHWGIHFVEGAIADYQRQVAYAAIDAGAGIVLGHHPHILKGIEVYRGCPIFYSMGNFAIEQPATWNADLRECEAYKTINALNPTWDMDAAYTLPDETRRTLIVRCRIRNGEIAETSFLPAYIEDGSAPRLLTADDSRFGMVEAYVEKLSREQGLAGRLERRGNEIRVSA